jgi:hypothetical protein
VKKAADFFFGEYYVDDGTPVISLHELASLTKKVDAGFFSRQLNRFLKANGGRVFFSEGTSSPPFWQFIDKLAPDAIGVIEIYARTDMNQAVSATLACDIVMDQGIVSVAPQWCAYKDIRADEIVGTLLLPLHLKGLEARCLIRWEDGKTERLSRNMNYEEELAQVFKLSKYPSAFGYGEEGRKRFEKHVQDLKLASEAYAMHANKPTGEAAWSILDSLREMRTT